MAAISFVTVVVAVIAAAAVLALALIQEAVLG